MPAYHEQSLTDLRARYWDEAWRMTWLSSIPVLIASFVFSALIYYADYIEAQHYFTRDVLTTEAAVSAYLSIFALIAPIFGVISIVMCFVMSGPFPTKRFIERERKATEIAHAIVAQDELRRTLN